MSRFSFLNEADGGINIRQTSSTSSASTGTANTNNRTTAQQASTTSTVRNATTSVSDDQKNNIRSHAASVTSDTKITAQNVDTFSKAFKNTMKNYTNLAGLIFTCKANAVLQISKDYFELIRAHVQSYEGTPNKTEDDKTTDAGTNYPNPTPAQAPPQNNQPPAQQGANQQ